MATIAGEAAFSSTFRLGIFALAPKRCYRFLALVSLSMVAFGLRKEVVQNLVHGRWFAA